jgi:threonine aldolase
MRQAGILAAAGIVALNEMVERLADDHSTARFLADGLAELPGIRVAPEMVRTNMVFFELADDIPWSSDVIADRLREAAGIWVGTNGPRGFRAVTHYWIGPHDVRAFVSGMAEVLSALRQSEPVAWV